MPIEWNEELELHIKIIDLQHKQLIKVTNELLTKIDKPLPETKLDAIFQEIIRYTQYHFGTEEFFLKKFNCDSSQTILHIQEHEKFKSEVARLYQLVKIDKTKSIFELINLLENWLIHHIPTVDKKYVECFHQNKLY